MRAGAVFKGILFGAFWGGVIGVSAVTIGSFLAPQPAGNQPPQAPQVAGPAEVDADPDDGGSVAALDVVTTETQTDDAAPQVAVPAQDDVVAGLVETTPLDAPDAPTVADSLETPSGVEAPELSVDAVAPVLPNPQSVAPQLPPADTQAEVLTEPAAPPPLPEGDVVAVIVAPEGPAPAPLAQPDGEAGSPSAPAVIATLPDETDTPDLMVDETASAAPAVPQPAENPVVEPEAVATEETGEEAPAEAEAEAAPAEPVEEPQPETPPSEEATAAETETEVAVVEPRVPAAPQDDTSAEVSILTLGGSDLSDRQTTVRVLRPGASDVATGGGEDSATAADLDPDAPAWKRYAAIFDAETDAPVVGIVLLDDGSLSDAPAQVAELGGAITVAVPLDLPDAADRLEAYRARGVEVALTLQLPALARASDVEVTMQSALRTMPEIVALADFGQSGLQANRDATEQVMAALSEDGRGFMTISRGLNSAQRAAQSAGLPTAIIYRDMDAENEEAGAIRRYLDQAAFRARQTGAVLLAGNIRVETLAALADWTDGGGQIAPLTAVFARGAE